MFKKLAVAGVAVVLGLTLVSWAGLGSYATTAWTNIRNHFKKQVPLEFEIQRVRNEVAQLIPDMKKNFKVVAEEMVAIDNLKEEISVARANLRQQKADILTMTNDLNSGTETIVYDGREFSADRVRDKLDHDFASYKALESEVKSKERLLTAKEKALDAARAQLAAVRQQKQDLEVQIAELEAQLQTVRLAEARSKVHIDNSRLSRCKATLADIRNRLNAEIKTVELENEFSTDAIPVDKKARSVSELTHDINAHFGQSPRGNGKVAIGK
ncbi:MAG TPA: hypothetical protein VG013_33625 [Gemmataceae bacterium]|jgi:chromosome segregation ATPase|nr:hypothetical protein [Gemmataceae bacterium]